MSVAAITAVWSAEQLSGSALLVALALADWADDSGRCYPSTSSVARKTRLSRSQAQRILKSLEDAGVVTVEANAAGGPPGATKRLRLRIDRLTKSSKTGSTGATPTGSAGATGSTHARDGSHPCAKTGSAGATQTVIEPSRTVIGKVDQDKPVRLPACPVEKIVDLYHEVLPELPRIKMMAAKRRRALDVFWRWVLSTKKSDGTRRATTAAEALDWIKKYFERARENDFLMNRTGRGPGHENWKANLDYLITEQGLVQVIEKTPEVT